MSTTILLADDHAILRDGLRLLIEGESDLKVVAVAESGRQAVELAAKLCPDLTIMDIGMHDLNGVDATRRIIAGNPRAKVIALSAYADRQFVLAMLEAGAWGYIVKSAASEELLRAVRAVLSGQKYLCPRIAGLVVDSYTGRLLPGQHSAKDLLTNREREILQLLAEGNTSREIAKSLVISDATVDVHRRNIMKKLGLHNVAELTKYAIRQGLTSA